MGRVHLDTLLSRYHYFRALQDSQQAAMPPSRPTAALRGRGR